jgi:hypothetical protein
LCQRVSDPRGTDRWAGWSVTKAKVNLKALSALCKEFLKGRGPCIVFAAARFAVAWFATLLRQDAFLVLLSLAVLIRVGISHFGGLCVEEEDKRTKPGQ